MQRVMPDKRFCECVFDLTHIAEELIEGAGWTGSEDCHSPKWLDSRDLFEEIYRLAAEFEYGEDGSLTYYDEGNYLRDIEAFGQEKLRKYLGLEYE